jgi:hypothetical protein
MVLLHHYVLAGTAPGGRALLRHRGRQQRRDLPRLWLPLMALLLGLCQGPSVHRGTLVGWLSSAAPPPHAGWTGRRPATRSSTIAARELEGTGLDRGRNAANSSAREEIWPEESTGLRGGRPRQRSRGGGGEWRARSRVCSMSSLLERCKRDVLYFLPKEKDLKDLLELLLVTIFYYHLRNTKCRWFNYY